MLHCLRDNDLFKLKSLEIRGMYTFNARSIHVNKYLLVIFWIDAIKVWFTLGKFLLELSRGILSLGEFSFG